MFVTVALIHPTARIVPLLTNIAQEVVAEIDLLHFVDEGLPRLVAADGGVTERTVARVATLARYAERSEAEAIVITSPLIGVARDTAQAMVRIPVIRIDGPMAERAVSFANRVGVLSSHESLLRPVVAQLREAADAAGRDLQLQTAVCEEALDALEAGYTPEYERLVLDGIDRLAGNEIIVLADVTMHPVVHAGTERADVPVLCAPRLAFEDVARRLNYFRR
jgi:aspartate/glutamate racemase